MFFKNILKFTSILAILFLITYLLFPIIKSFVECIILLIDSNRFIIASILMLGIILYLCKCTNNNDKTNTKKKNKLFDDETDKEFNRDKVLGLKNIINSHKGDSFFSLALIGAWGSGKSSFLRKLEDEINDEKKDIVIYLNVWELENIQNILQEIEKEFDNIILKLSPIEWILYHLKSILTKNYFSILSKYFVENSISISLPFSNTIKDLKKDYNNLLKRVLEDKKIVLILDELDRLESKEDVLSIFKVIRYLTSFDKVFTITGLDINKLPKDIELDYTHKIFNSKYVIPKTTRTELLNFLREEGEKLLTFSIKEESKQKKGFVSKEEFNKILNTNIDNINLCLIDFIKTYREAKSILNDTYMICNSLKEHSNLKDNWDKYISFEFILVLNILKSVNLEFYLKFMNEEEKIQLSIINGYRTNKSDQEKRIEESLKKLGNNNKPTLNENEKNKLNKFLEYGNIFYIFSYLNYVVTNFSQELYIYTHQNIYDYMFTEDEYKKFVEDTNAIKEKIKSLNNIQISHHYKPNDNNLEDNFIILLIQRLHDEPDRDNRSKIIETIFKEDSKEHQLAILSQLIELNNSFDVMEELFKFILKDLKDLKDENIKWHINGFIINIISKNKNVLMKPLFNIIKGTSYEKSFIDNFLKLKYISETKEKLLELVIFINIILEEDYSTFFKDEEIYSIYLRTGGNSFSSKDVSGKELKKIINENTELQEEFKKHKESKLEKKEEK